MKYLKSFQKLNESLLDDILQGKIYKQIDDIDFDEITVELSDTYGKEEWTELDIRRIRTLVERYLCLDKRRRPFLFLHQNFEKADELPA